MSATTMVHLAKDVTFKSVRRYDNIGSPYIVISVKDNESDTNLFMDREQFIALKNQIIGFDREQYGRS